MWLKPQPWTKVVETYLKFRPLDNNYNKRPEIPLPPSRSCLQEAQTALVSTHIALGGGGGGERRLVNARFMSLKEICFPMERRIERVSTISSRIIA